VIPPRVAQAFTDSSIVLLGYDLADWDFRVLFRGLITSKSSSRRRLNVAIQLEPKNDKELTKSYLEKYFGMENFDIYWGKSQDFLRTLWQDLESG